MRTIALIGPMGAGKTTLGKKLARALGLQFSDTDKLIVERFGDISAIFRDKGEGFFREQEAAALRECLSRGGVVATGGGVVLRPDNREILAQCLVIYLKTTLSAIEGRLDKTKRPLIADDATAWQRIFDERRELYEELAEVTVETGNRRSEDVIAELVTTVGSEK